MLAEVVADADRDAVDGARLLLLVGSEVGSKPYCPICCSVSPVAVGVANPRTTTITEAARRVRPRMRKIVTVSHLDLDDALDDERAHDDHDRRDDDGDDADGRFEERLDEEG